MNNGGWKKVKVFLYGVMAEENFGGPSLMHGAREIIHKLSPNSEIVCYQKTEASDLAISDMGFPVYQIPYARGLSIFIDAIKYKVGIKPRTLDKQLFFYHLKSSDIIANLFGICFCSNFDKGTSCKTKIIIKSFSKYIISVIGRLYGKKTVKCTSSYGPIKSKYDMVSAKIASRYIFNIMYAREKQSYYEIYKAIGENKKIQVSPDLANLMPCVVSNKIDKRPIGISVSYQILKQWRSGEAYIDCIVNIINHIINKTDHKVVLIPNEISSTLLYHDQHVAEEIIEKLKFNKRVSTIDLFKINSTQLKSIIQNCEILIASRYHSCVAGLSSGVPTLVIGWHYKYQELLELYHQQRWIISNDDCTSHKLISMFDELWDRRNKEKNIILRNYKVVCDQLIEAGKNMFLI